MKSEFDRGREKCADDFDTNVDTPDRQEGE